MLKNIIVDPDTPTHKTFLRGRAPPPGWWGGGVVGCYGLADTNNGWFLAPSHEWFVQADLAWDYPGVVVQSKCLVLLTLGCPQDALPQHCPPPTPPSPPPSPPFPPPPEDVTLQDKDCRVGGRRDGGGSRAVVHEGDLTKHVSTLLGVDTHVHTLATLKHLRSGRPRPRGGGGG